MSQPTVLVPAGPYTSDTVPNQKDWSPKSTANGIQDEVIRQVLQSMADLRRYILVEKPALLAKASPCLVDAESQIFSIMGQLDR